MPRLAPGSNHAQAAVSRHAQLKETPLLPPSPRLHPPASFHPVRCFHPTGK
ncbi:hypothetical protein SLG_15660 [Sphingobium sp. SYK-6]|nr:hypothetical protein SLG_15660 [Sphingobium sp. SYK-6]